MVVLVTGGTGFIGVHTIRRLRQGGLDVKVLARGERPAPELQRLGCSFAGGDVTSLGAVLDAMQGVDAAVHLVGIIIEAGAQTFQRVHVEGTRNVVNAAKERGLSRLVHISALGTSDKALSRYHQTKWEAEQLIRASGVPYTILRPSLVFGPEDKFFNMLRPMVRYAPITPVVGQGESRFQPVFVEDLAEVIYLCLSTDKATNMTLAVGGPDIMTFNEMLDGMASVFGKAPRLKLHAPISLVRPFVRMVEAVFSRPPLTTDQLKMLELDNICTENNAATVFGLKMTALKDGLRQYWT